MPLIEQETYGDKDQTKLRDQININEGEKPMDTNKIQALFDEVEIYKQAIQDAKDALESAEQELDETLAAEYVEE